MPRWVAVSGSRCHVVVHKLERRPQLARRRWRDRAALDHAWPGHSGPGVCDDGDSVRSARSGVRWARRRHPGAAHRRRSAPRGDPARSPSEERRMTLGDIGVPPADPTGGPDLVQLLTPEGERVDHPDYPLDVSADECRDLYRDLVLVRRIDVEATALQRQGELGIWASLLGQEAAQVGSGRALPPRRHGLPDLPGARRGLVPRGRPAATARPLPWRQPRRLGPEGAATSTSTRSSSAPRPCTRPATRWASSGTAARTP